MASTARSASVEGSVPASGFAHRRSLESPVRSRAAAEEERERTAWELLVVRVRREFEEMPGLSLTLAQGVRLFGLPEERCRRVFARLEAEGLLHRTARGLWVLRGSAA